MSWSMGIVMHYYMELMILHIYDLGDLYVYDVCIILSGWYLSI